MAAGSNDKFAGCSMGLQDQWAAGTSGPTQAGAVLAAFVVRLKFLVSRTGGEPNRQTDVKRFCGVGPVVTLAATWMAG